MKIDPYSDHPLAKLARREHALATGSTGKPGAPTPPTFAQHMLSGLMFGLGAIGPGRGTIPNAALTSPTIGRHMTHAGPYSANTPGKSRNPWIARNLPQYIVDEMAAARRGTSETPAATYRELGARYGMDPSTIFNILTRRAASSTTTIPPENIPLGRSGPRPVDRNMVDRVREMAGNGFTQDQMASALGVSRSNVSRMMSSNNITRALKPPPVDTIRERLNQGYPIQHIANQLGMSRTNVRRIIDQHDIRPTLSGEEITGNRETLRAAGTIPTPGVRPLQRHSGQFGARRTKNDNINPLTGQNEYVRPSYSFNEGYTFAPPKLPQANTIPDPLTLQSWGLIPGVGRPNMPRWMNNPETGERMVSTPPGYRPVEFDPVFEPIAQSNERNRALFQGRPEARTMIPANRRTYLNEEGETINESLNLAIMRQLGILPKHTP